MSTVPAPPRAVPIQPGELALGFDFGTSGARCALVDYAGQLVCSPPPFPWGERERLQTAADWTAALHALLDSVPVEQRQRVARIAVSGTSGSVLLCDSASGEASSRGCRMYDFSVTQQAPDGTGDRAMAMLKAAAPDGHTACSPTSALAKVLAWHCEDSLLPNEVIVHQADFVAAQLCGGPPVGSDWNNALKLGFDVSTLEYPPWMSSGALGEVLKGRLPQVVRPGAVLGQIDSALVERYGLPSSCQVLGGTTDSIAAFIASGTTSIGEAVTSLGSTLAIKLLSTVPVSDGARGIYSHRLGDLWLVGGASNAGCAVLREHGFSVDELSRLSATIDPATPPLHTHYYPLPAATVGERFPIADESKVSVLDPVPTERMDFLHCILHGIARVEAEGYAALAELGASELSRVLTCGGGAENPQWTELRQHMLGVPTSRAPETDAALGAAILACGR